MTKGKVVWSDVEGDLRKKKPLTKSDAQDPPVDEKNIVLEIRRLKSGKGRIVIELRGLPANKSWCKKLSKELKKLLGTGGAFKNDYVEVHGDKLDQITDYLDKRLLKWKKTGG